VLAALEEARGRVEDVVVVLDLDETCFTANTTDALATSAWFEDLQQRLVPILRSEAGMKPVEVLLESLALVDCFYPLVPAKVTEEALPGLLRKYKAEGVATIGLTARGPDLAQATWQQFGDECPLVFDSLSPPLDSSSLKDLEELLKANGHAAPDCPDDWPGILQDRGVWFTANANKGAMLRHTLKAGLHVIFADDSERHLHNVLAALDGHAASVRVLHYTAAKDAAKARLDAVSCDLALAGHCAALYQKRDRRFLELVQRKPEVLKAIVGHQVQHLESQQQPVDASLRSLASLLQ